MLISGCFEVVRPAQRDIDVVNARQIFGDPVYKHPAVPGYEGKHLGILGKNGNFEFVDGDMEKWFK